MLEEPQRGNCMSHHFWDILSKTWGYHITISVPSPGLPHPSGSLSWDLNVSLLLPLTPSEVLVSAVRILGKEMMLSNIMSILTLSEAHTRLRNETHGLFEFLPLHPSPFSLLRSLMCSDCINKNLACKLSKLLLCQTILKGPAKKWKDKKFQKPKKKQVSC